MTVPTSGRVQLALNVEDLDVSIAFYSNLFGVPPAKVRPGYANFAVVDPPLKLVLIEGGDGGSINHLGVEVTDATAVDAAASRFATAGLETDIEQETACCYALQDKVWVTAPDGERWEYYHVIADVEAAPTDQEAACCSVSPTSSVAV